MGERILIAHEITDWVPKAAIVARDGWTPHMIDALHNAGLITIKRLGRLEFVSKSEIQKAIESLPAKNSHGKPAKKKAPPQRGGDGGTECEGTVPAPGRARRPSADIEPVE